MLYVLVVLLHCDIVHIILLVLLGVRSIIMVIIVELPSQKRSLREDMSHNRATLLLLQSLPLLLLLLVVLVVIIIIIIIILIIIISSSNMLSFILREDMSHNREAHVRSDFPSGYGGHDIYTLYIYIYIHTYTYTCMLIIIIIITIQFVV